MTWKLKVKGGKQTMRLTKEKYCLDLNGKNEMK